MSVMRIVCLSDTHLRTPAAGVPEGDILVHAGDLTMGGTEPETEEALQWLEGLPHKHKLVIAGNHDFLFEGRAPRARAIMATHPALTYLQDTGVTIGDLNLWGTPWQPWYYDWAFNLRRGAEIKAKWDLIPPNTDVLIVHGPPAGWLDRNSQGKQCGCADLLAAVQHIAPHLVVFGHIHEGYGEAELVDKGHRIRLINASICDAGYQPVNRPVVVDLS